MAADVAAFGAPVPRDDPSVTTRVARASMASTSIARGGDRVVTTVSPSTRRRARSSTSWRTQNADDGVDGILVQLPLPEHGRAQVLRSVDPVKDVDGFHPANAGLLYLGEPFLRSGDALRGDGDARAALASSSRRQW